MPQTDSTEERILKIASKVAPRPVLSYAFAAAALVALISIISRFGLNVRTILFGSIVAVVLMVILHLPDLKIGSGNALSLVNELKLI